MTSGVKRAPAGQDDALDAICRSLEALDLDVADDLDAVAREHVAYPLADL
jgi:hypothetical protein